MSMEIAIWVLGGAVSIIGMLVATLWQMTRAEQKAQDEAIRDKADKTTVSDSQLRHDKEFDRIREEQTRLMDKADERHQRELSAMESRLSSKIDLILELLKKDRQ